MEMPVKYKHFSPSFEDQAICNGHLRIIQELAPDSANLNVEVDRLRDGIFETNIHIIAAWGQFESHAQGTSPLRSIREAKNSILKILEEWKQWRF